jgi:hypothetical protein
MTLPSYIDLSSVEDAYLVANTPHYLLRRLRGNPIVRTLTQSLSPEELASAYRASVHKSPDSFRELVVPYICIVAIATTGRMDLLKELEGVSINSGYKWLRQIVEIVIETFRPTITKELRISPTLQIGATQYNTVPTKSVKLKISELPA